jgi:Ca2+-binding EF-hand superfamily protein
MAQLAKRNEFNLQQQIQAKNASGVPESDLKDWNETFDHFDRNKSNTLDYPELKSCLRSVGLFL